MTGRDPAGLALLGGLAALLLTGLPTGARGAGFRPEAPAYRPAAVGFPGDATYVTADGRIRIVGYNDMLEMLTAIDALFVRSHPGFAFDLVLQGTRTAPPALIDGASAFAPVGAPFPQADIARYRASIGNDPLVFRIAHASLNPKARSAPLGVFVNADNPLVALTMGQLAQVFAGGRGRDHIRYWGEFGLTGAWGPREIHPVGLAPETALGAFFKARLFAAGDFDPDFVGFPQSSDVIKRVTEDRRLSDSPPSIWRRPWRGRWRWRPAPTRVRLREARTICWPAATRSTVTSISMSAAIPAAASTRSCGNICGSSFRARASRRSPPGS